MGILVMLHVVCSMIKHLNWTLLVQQPYFNVRVILAQLFNKRLRYTFQQFPKATHRSCSFHPLSCT